MKIIDAHLHLCKEPYFDKIAVEAGHCNTEEHLGKQFQELSIEYGIVMGNQRSLDFQPEPYPSFLYYCLGMNQEWLAPGEVAASLPHIEKHLQYNRCVGIKLYPGYESFSADSPICDPLYELALRYHKPIAVHTGFTAQGDTSPHCHPDTIGRAACRWPELSFVMCHIGNPWIAQGIDVINSCPNVSADLSGILEGQTKDREALPELIEEFYMLQEGFERIKDFDRLMHGTDWPLANLADYLYFTAKVVPPEHHEAVFYENARRIYNLP